MGRTSETFEIYKSDDGFPVPTSVNEFAEGLPIYEKLFHVSGWEALRELNPGDVFTLRPGVHNAQGEGVYFSEELPRFTAAEGSRDKAKALIIIVAQDEDGWYRSRPELAVKHGKPRSWHTKGKSMDLKVLTRHMVDFNGEVIPSFNCVWKWNGENEISSVE